MLLRNKKILFFVLGFLVVIGVGSWLIFSSSGDTELQSEEAGGAAVSGDEQKTSEAEQLAEDIQNKLNFFAHKGLMDFFEKHQDLIPVTVGLSELAVENPFQDFPKSGGEFLQEEEAGAEEIISQPEPY